MDQILSVMNIAKGVGIMESNSLEERGSLELLDSCRFLRLKEMMDKSKFLLTSVMIREMMHQSIKGEACSKV